VNVLLGFGSSMPCRFPFLVDATLFSRLPPLSLLISFYFRHICELFDTIDGSRAKSPGNIGAAVHTWFDEHDADIPRHGPGAVAFLSCLLIGHVREVRRSLLGSWITRFWDRRHACSTGFALAPVIDSWHAPLVVCSVL
jgi:hypothetical protein